MPASAPQLDDVRSSDAVERLLEDSWSRRSRTIESRERIVESIATALFLLSAVSLAAFSPALRSFDAPLAVTLVALYALTSRVIKFPLGAGYVVPSYLVLAPMLLLLPPSLVPLLAACGFVLGAIWEVTSGGAGRSRLAFSIADAWHTLGPATVLVLAGPTKGTASLAIVYTLAFAAGCLVDLASSMVREALVSAVQPAVQFRVILVVWLIDACIAPLGVLVARAVTGAPAAIVLLVPFMAVMLLASRERTARIARMQEHMEILSRERSRLQNAVECLADALVAKLDLRALARIVLRGSIEALAADGGRITLQGPFDPLTIELGSTAEHEAALTNAAQGARGTNRPCQTPTGGSWALAVPFSFLDGPDETVAVLSLARADREFRDDELAVAESLVERARDSAVEIAGHEQLQIQALTDPLTRIGNRRKLIADMEARIGRTNTGEAAPVVVALLDLDGFKAYNDTFGHAAGDEMLGRVATTLTAALENRGEVYRLGGDEFCVVSSLSREMLERRLTDALQLPYESGRGESLKASIGTTAMPLEAGELGEALRIADMRMYARKRARPRDAAASLRRPGRTEAGSA